MEGDKKVYVATADELYKKYIKPLPENKANSDLVEKHPEMRKYLDIMSKHKKISIELGELLI